jgi:hypothetical protein
LRTIGGGLALAILTVALLLFKMHKASQNESVLR